MVFRITFDPVKRNETLRRRRLKFEDAASLFDGYTVDNIDDRFDYDEERWITVGVIADKVVIVVWTEVDDRTRRVISMRAADGDEQAEYWKKLAEG